MKKNFKFYLIIWAALLVFFNATVFLLRAFVPAYSNGFEVSFWIAWAGVLVGFIGNLICAFYVFRTDSLKKTFYNLPVIRISWAAMIAMTVIGTALMLIPVFPFWITAIICIAILAFNVIAVTKALWASGTVQKIDDKVKAQTSFIKNLAADTENIMARAKSDAVREECRKVCEAVRSSDPMSVPELNVVEAQLTLKADALGAAVSADDAGKVKELADEFVILVKERNNKCKLMK